MSPTTSALAKGGGGRTIEAGMSLLAYRLRRRGLSALGPPPELESDVEALLRNAEFVADTLEKVADAVRKEGSLAALGMTQVLTETEKEADRLARRIGADCIGPD